jgi:hypothetical protein
MLLRIAAIGLRPLAATFSPSASVIFITPKTFISKASRQLC